MRFIHYVAGDEKSHKEVGQKLRELKPGRYIIQIQRNRPVRSLSQNKYYHAILKIIAISTGEYDMDRLHEVCKKKFNGELINFPKSGAEQIGKSTASLDTAEFTGYVNRVKRWAHDEFGIVIPEKANVDQQRWMEIESTYEDNFNQ